MLKWLMGTGNNHLENKIKWSKPWAKGDKHTFRVTESQETWVQWAILWSQIML